MSILNTNHPYFFFMLSKGKIYASRRDIGSFFSIRSSIVVEIHVFIMDYTFSYVLSNLVLI